MPDSIGWLRAEAAVPDAVVTQRAQEVHPAKLRPVRLAEPELGMRRLPQQEAGQPLLAGRPDHQVRVWLTRGVEVLRDVVDVEYFGQLLDRGAALRVAQQ